jgi:hypothetical protein
VKLTCPSCGAAIDFDQAVRGTDNEALAKAAALFGADWDLVSEYVDGFRARRDAALPFKKRLRLLREVWEMWRDCRFQFDGQEYVIGREEFKAALAQVSNRELTGLKNHNYLKQVLKAAAREYGKRVETQRIEREHQLQAGVGKREEEPADPRVPELVKMVLFGASDADKAEAQALLDQIRGEAKCRATK